MSIRFVDNLDEEPKHGFYAVGSKFIFAMVNGIPKPCEFIDGDTGEHIAFGVPVVV